MKWCDQKRVVFTIIISLLLSLCSFSFLPPSCPSSSPSFFPPSLILSLHPFLWTSGANIWANYILLTIITGWKSVSFSHFPSFPGLPNRSLHRYSRNIVDTYPWQYMHTCKLYDVWCMYIYFSFLWIVIYHWSLCLVFTQHSISKKCSSCYYFWLLAIIIP